ncbi:MAG: nucleotidyltransferase family protein [Euryarchaeota archaeon]|nr:nucleotidyltransferase family protein [Euryarchaeota archaeon]
MIGVELDRDALAAFCRRHHVKRLSLFGSVLRDDFGPLSDVDALVDFEEGHLPTLFEMVRMERELSEEVFAGRTVDLRTKEDLSRYFRDEVVAQAEPVYGAG